MNKIIPSTKVRTQWRKLVKSLPRDQAFTVTRHYKKEAVIADPDYFEQLERSFNHRKLIEAMDAISANFEKSLRKQGVDPNKLTEMEVEKLLDIGQ